MKTRCLIGAAVMAAAINCCNVVDAQNDFTSTNGWVRDRYAPNSFTAVMFQGRPTLQIGIDPAQSLSNRPPAYQGTFYNTQGYKQPSAVSNGIWTVSGALWVDASTLAGTAPYRSDLWARSTPVIESNADYFIMGLFAGDLTNTADPNPTTDNFGVTWRVWDDVVGVWNNLSIPVAAGWNTITISYDGTNVNYYLNGNPVCTDTNLGNPAYDNQLGWVFLEAYNFGNNAYTASWSGINDSVAGPSLSLTPAGNQVTLQWPACATNYILEATTNLFAPNWVTITNCAAIPCGLTMTNLCPPMFFRLHQL